MTKKTKDILQLLIGVIVLIGINIITYQKFLRIDLTEDGRYTLSDSTKQMLRNLDDVILVKVYLSGEMPTQFKRLNNTVHEMLDIMRNYAGNNLQYIFINPFENSDKTIQANLQEELYKKGLTGYTYTERTEKGVAQKRIYPGAVISYKGRELPVHLLRNLYDPRKAQRILQKSIENMEYELSSAFYRLIHANNQKGVAFSVGHGEMEANKMHDVLSEIAKYYNLRQVEISNQLDIIPEDTKLLVIAKPTQSFNEASKFIIDQFIMHGGNVLWLLDMVNVKIDSLRKNGYTMGMPNRIKLQKQLFQYGAKVKLELIQDVVCAPTVAVVGGYGERVKMQTLPWWFYPVIVTHSEHPIAKKTGNIKLEYVNPIDTVSVQEVEKTILLTTSKYSRSLLSPVRISADILGREPNLKLFSQPYLSVAVLLEGRFKSIYRNRLVPISDANYDYKEESPPNTKQIVISDGDIIRNEFKDNGDPLPLGLDVQTKTYFAGNKSFILNAINYLCGDSWFIALRSKDFKAMLLDKEKVKKEKKYWQALNTGGPIILLILFGVVFNAIRIRRYAR